MSDFYQADKNVWIWRGSWSSRSFVPVVFKCLPRPSLAGISVTGINKQGAKCELYLHDQDNTAPSPLSRPAPDAREGTPRAPESVTVMDRGVSAMERRFFISPPLNKFCFPSSFLASLPAVVAV